MTLALLYLLLLYLFAVIKRPQICTNGFNLEHTIPLRGVLALFVVFGHLDTVISSQSGILFLLHLSTPAVAVFFFMSGYGLMYSYNKKGKKYLDRFIYNTIVKLFVPLLLLSLCYQGVLYILERFDAHRLLIDYISGNETALVHSWYVYVLIIFYSFYYFVFKVNLSTNTKIFLIFVLVAGYWAITKYVFHWPNFWWMTCFAFPMGLLFVEYEESIRSNKLSIYGCVVAILLLLIIRKIDNNNSLLTIEIPYMLLGPFVAILLSYLPFSTHNRFLNFLGTISFEIYLIHGAFEKLLLGIFDNPYLYVIIVILFTIVLSYFVHKLLSKINHALIHP